jgi:hypothetical protein
MDKKLSSTPDEPEFVALEFFEIPASADIITSGITFINLKKNEL